VISFIEIVIIRINTDCKIMSIFVSFLLLLDVTDIVDGLLVSNYIKKPSSLHSLFLYLRYTLVFLLLIYLHPCIMKVIIVISTTREYFQIKVSISGSLSLY
jgi:hypothetical protein